MRIGELAQATGTTTGTLRFYEQAGVLAAPARAANGYRDFPAEAVTRVDVVRAAQAAGLTLAQIREILEVRDGGRQPCAHVARLVEARLDEVASRLAELERTRDELLRLRGRLEGLDPSQCREDDICVAFRP